LPPSCFSSGGCTLTNAAVAFNVNDPTTSWTRITNPSSDGDDSGDEENGSSEGDIVGGALHGSVYAIYANAGTPSESDDSIGFRVRLAEDANPPGFSGAFYIGIDADGDGALDLFVGVDNTGSDEVVGLWSPNAGAVSPDTTTIGGTPLVSYAQTSVNYSWAPVTLTLDPTVGTDIDLDGGGRTDRFLSFRVPFADVVFQLGVRGITGFNQNSPVTYVFGTSHSGNNLGTDFNGVPKDYDPSARWSVLGATSNVISLAGTYAVPEPTPAALLGGMAVLRLFTKRRR